jgi:hypothetical protein
MIKILKAPYPCEGTNSTKWKSAVLMGSFVFLFLFFFQPFGLNTYPSGILELTLGYGLTCFITMAILNILIPTVFQNYFNEEGWNVGKQLFWSIVNVTFIGLANLLYSNYVGIANLSFGNLMIFEGFTVAVAVFPLLLFVISNYRVLKSKFEKSASAINLGINKSIKANNLISEETITLASETNGDNLSLAAEHLLYIQSADNYLTVYFLKDGKPTSYLIRNTLKTIDEQLSAWPIFFRCHKSYLVNLEKVAHISGNAQGLKLHLKDLDNLIPVSRSHNKIIKDRLTIRP